MSPESVLVTQWQPWPFPEHGLQVQPQSSAARLDCEPLQNPSLLEMLRHLLQLAVALFSVKLTTVFQCSLQPGGGCRVRHNSTVQTGF